jgi:sugar lactone lactonase YvrE
MRAPCRRGVLSRFGAVVLVATVGLIALGAPSRAAARVARAAPTTPYAVGTVFVADFANDRVVQVSPGAPQTTVGSGLLGPFSVALDREGNLYIADSAKNRVAVVPADGGTQTSVGSGLDTPTGVAVDQDGNIYIADLGNNRVVRVPAGGGAQTTVGSGLSTPSGVAVDQTGDVYIADQGNDRVVKVHAAGGGQTTVGTGLSGLKA